jgi:hypothetical protein
MCIHLFCTISNDTVKWRILRGILVLGCHFCHAPTLVTFTTGLYAFDPGHENSSPVYGSCHGEEIFTPKAKHDRELEDESSYKGGIIFC